MLLVRGGPLRVLGLGNGSDGDNVRLDCRDIRGCNGGTSTKRRFFAVWAVPEIGFEFGPAFVKRNGVAESTNDGVTGSEGQPTRNEADGVDSV